MLPLVGISVASLLGLVAWAKTTTDAMVRERKISNAKKLTKMFPDMQVYAPAAPPVELYFDAAIAEAAKRGDPWAKAWGRLVYEMYKDDLPTPRPRG